MKCAFFTNTPAHVHLYKHAAAALRKRGHDVQLFARDYGCTVELLEWHDLPYTVYGRCETTKYSLVRELPRHYLRMIARTRRFDPDLVFGVGAYAAHAGATARAPTVLIHDSEPTTLDHAVSRPFAEAILTPAAFRKDLGSNHYVFDGFKESAYLHPAVFEPRADVRERLGVGPDERMAIVRFNAFGSHHDVGRGGFAPEQRRAVVEHLAERATVFVSDESETLTMDSLPARQFDLHPALLHDALATADLLVADSQTTVTEAALLGTPAVRSNSFVGEDDMGNFLELERHGLVHNVAAFEDVIETTTTLLEADDVQDTWRRRRDEYVADMVNLTDLIVDIATDPELPGDPGTIRALEPQSMPVAST